MIDYDYYKIDEDIVRLFKGNKEVGHFCIDNMIKILSR